MHCKVRIGGRDETVEIVEQGAITLARLDGRDHPIALISRSGNQFEFEIDGVRSVVEFLEEGLTSVRLEIDGEEFAVQRVRTAEEGTGGRELPPIVEVASILPGKVASVVVRPGDIVHAGDPVVLIDSMKMETSMRAEYDGTVQDILVAPGEVVRKRQPLVRIRTGSPGTR